MREIKKRKLQITEKSYYHPAIRPTALEPSGPEYIVEPSDYADPGSNFELEQGDCIFFEDNALGQYSDEYEDSLMSDETIMEMPDDSLYENH